MNSSGFYGNLDNVTNRMAIMLLQNEDFTKYLYYTDSNPLGHIEVPSINDILEKKLILQPKPDELQAQEGIIVEMFFSGDTPSRQSGGFLTEYVITFNIMCHLSTWKVNGGKRPYRIMNIIDSTFNDKDIKDISYGKIRPLGSKFMKFADNWEGYKLAYVLTWNGNAGC